MGKALAAAVVATLLVASAATTATAGSALAPQTTAAPPDLAPASVNNAFESLNPARILDTRAGSTTTDGQYAGVGPVGPFATLDLAVVGRGGVPALGVGAVAINVTAVSPTGSGYLTVWPKGAAMPNASNLNFVANDVVPNLVIVRVGTDGKISIFNEAGTTHLLVDVVGWFADNAGLQPLVPARLLDTRPGTETIDGAFAGAGAVSDNTTASLLVTGRGSVPSTGVSTVVLNVTVTGPTDGGYITAWPSGDGQPNASNLNFTPNQTVANLVITKVGPDGRVNLYNSSGATHLIADVMGWFGSDSELHSLLPARLLDTRPGSSTIDGAFAGGSALGPRATLPLVVAGRGGVPATGVAAVVLNVTVTAPSADSYLTVWPTGFALPNASSLNYVAGKTVPNMVIARVGDGGSVSLYNSVGTTHVIVDVVGWLPPNVPMVLTQLNLLPGVATQPYSAPIGLAGSQSPYSFSASGLAPGLALSNSGVFSGTPAKPGTTSTQFEVSDRFGRTGHTTLPHNIFPASSGFTAIAPTTVLDTLTQSNPINANETRSVLVGGVGAVPASGVVPVLSVGVLSYEAGFMTVYPTGGSQPMSAHFSFGEYSTDRDIQIVPMGVGGQINVYSMNKAHVRIDVIGYMPIGGSFSPVSAFRILDTRMSGAMATGAQLDVAVPGGAPGPTDVIAVVTTLGATADGSLNIWDSGGTPPDAPALRWGSSPTTTQFVVVHRGSNGSISLKNMSTASSVHVIVDIVAFFM